MKVRRLLSDSLKWDSKAQPYSKPYISPATARRNTSHRDSLYIAFNCQFHGQFNLKLIVRYRPHALPNTSRCNTKKSFMLCREWEKHFSCYVAPKGAARCSIIRTHRPQKAQPSCQDCFLHTCTSRKQLIWWCCCEQLSPANLHGRTTQKLFSVLFFIVSVWHAHACQKHVTRAGLNCSSSFLGVFFKAGILL